MSRVKRSQEYMAKAGGRRSVYIVEGQAADGVGPIAARALSPIGVPPYAAGATATSLLHLEILSATLEYLSSPTRMCQLQAGCLGRAR